MAALEITVDLFGDRELSRKLKRLPDAVQRRILKSAISKLGTATAKHVRRRAPVLTGKLKRGIEKKSYRIAKTGRFAGAVTTVVRTKPRSYFDIPPSSPWYYPTIVEYGREFASPVHYLAGAAKDVEPQAEQIVGDALRSKAEKEFAKL